MTSPNTGLQYSAHTVPSTHRKIPAAAGYATLKDSDVLADELCSLFVLYLPLDKFSPDRVNVLGVRSSGAVRAWCGKDSGEPYKQVEVER
jgi:hypothetical protein